MTSKIIAYKLAKLGEFRVFTLRETLEGPATTPEEVVAYWQASIATDKYHHGETESLYCVCVNVRRRVIGHHLVAHGTLDTILAHPREVFRPALVANAAPAEVWEKARKGQGITAPDAAVCLRAVLARRFPGTKFSVRADGSLSVNWTDGPSIQEVDRVAQNYSFQGFDGMIDMRYSVHRWLSRDGTMSLAHSTGTTGSMGSESEEIGDPHAPDAVEVRYGPDFVFTHREISPGVKRELAFKVCSKYGLPMPANFEDETDFERWLNTTTDGNGDYLCALVHRASCGEEL